MLSRNHGYCNTLSRCNALVHCCLVYQGGSYLHSNSASSSLSKNGPCLFTPQWIEENQTGWAEPAKMPGLNKKIGAKCYCGVKLIVLKNSGKHGWEVSSDFNTYQLKDQELLIREERLPTTIVHPPHCYLGKPNQKHQETWVALISKSTLNYKQIFKSKKHSPCPTKRQ